jgi:hypothetical protein
MFRAFTMPMRGKVEVHSQTLLRYLRSLLFGSNQWTAHWTGKTALLTNVYRQVDGWTGKIGQRGWVVKASEHQSVS